MLSDVQLTAQSGLQSMLLKETQHTFLTNASAPKSSVMPTSSCIGAPPLSAAPGAAAAASSAFTARCDASAAPDASPVPSSKAFLVLTDRDVC